jgi:hypothetical protein
MSMSVASAPNRGVFIYLDGDDVGAHIELHLLRDEVDASAALSAAVVRATGQIADDIRTHLGGRLIFAAGDEVLAIVPERPTSESIEVVRSTFQNATGLTISCGIGMTAAEAARNLRLAKLLGKDRLHGAVQT